MAIKRGMLVGFLIVGACSSNGKGGSTPGQQVTYKVPSTTKIVSPEEQSGILAVGSGGDPITLDGSSVLAGRVAVGDVLVFGIGDQTPHGLLRRVVTKSVDGTNVILTTTQAKLEDAFQELHFAVHQTVDPATMQSWTPNAQGLSVQRSALTVQGSAGYTFDVNFDDTVLYDDDGDPDTTYDQIIMNGSTSFSLSLDLEVDIGLFTMDRFKFGPTLAQNGSVTVSTNLPAAEFKKEISVATLYFPPFAVGPVVIVPQLELVVGAEGKLEAQVSTNITESATLEGGVQYQDGQWTPYQNVSTSFDYTPPTLSASGNVKAYAGPNVSLLIYDVAGPYVQIDGYLELTADISEDPWWTLDAGLEGVVGAKGDILGFVLVDYESDDFIGYKQVLAQATGPFTPVVGAIEPSRDGGSPDLGLAGSVDASLDVSSVVGTESNERIVYYKSPAPFSIYYANPDGTGETLVASNAVSDHEAPVGYGGGKTCYDNGSSVVVMNWDGTSSQTVPNTTDVTGEVDCSPDGSKVVYGSDSNHFTLSVIATDGSGKFTFSDGSAAPRHQLYPSWNAPGRIVFGQADYGNPYTQALYWKADDQPASTAQLLHPVFAQYPETGGPGGRISYNDLPGNLFVMDSDGSNVVALTLAGQGNAGPNKAWSNATGALFFQEAGDVWRINPDNTGLTKVLTDGNVRGVIGVVGVAR
jgi:hypothetical protein